MRRLEFVALLLCCVPACLANPASAQKVDNVCVVTFNNPAHGKALDVRAVAAASIMPRETASALTNGFIKIFDYPNLQASIDACQCLGNPQPETSMAERNKTLLSCPKPTRVE